MEKLHQDQEQISIIKKFQFQLPAQGLVCKYHNTNPYLLITSDSSGSLSFFNTYSSELQFQNKKQIQIIESILNKEIMNDILIYDMDISLDGTKLIIGTSALVTIVFDLEEQKIDQIHKGHQNSVKCVKFYEKNSDFFITGGKDGQLLYYDNRQNKQEQIKIVEFQNEKITGCGFYNDEKLILSSQSGSKDCSIWDLRMMYQYNKKKKTIVKSTSVCQMMTFNRYLHLQNNFKNLSLKIKQNNSLPEFQFQNLMQEFHIIKNFSQHNYDQIILEKSDKLGITSMNIFPELNFIITKDQSYNIDIYDGNSLGFSSPISFKGFKTFSSFEKIALNKSGEYLAMGGDQDIFLWIMNQQNQEPQIFSMCHDLDINGIDWNKFQQKELATVSDDNFGNVWEIEIQKKCQNQLIKKIIYQQIYNVITRKYRKQQQ